VSTGVVNVCLFGFDVASSANIQTIEANLNNMVNAYNGVTYTFNLESNSTRYFRFTLSTFSMPGNITVTMSNYNLATN